jgi:hypothetical protein
LPFIVGPNGGVNSLVLPGGPALPSPGYSVMENTGIREAFMGAYQDARHEMAQAGASPMSPEDRAATTVLDGRLLELAIEAIRPAQ